MTHELITAKGKITVTLTETPSGTVVISHNGKPVMAIRPAREDAAPTAMNVRPVLAVPDRQPQLTDLNGDPAHDWPIFVRRFQKTQPALVMDVAAFYKKQFGYSTPGIENMLRAGDDLVELQPVLSEVITTEGKLKYGARSAIARQLGIKDAGGYRDRIDAAISLLQGNYSALLEENEGILEVSGAKVEVSGQKVATSNRPTTFQEARKAANK